ncbi:MAG: hypothetical protein H6625_03485 [Bdellovibrionaceae bacterium]|nr:hypothetical protein [Pseudobdellovibrionaceae bacterium]
MILGSSNLCWFLIHRKNAAKSFLNFSLIRQCIEQALVQIEHPFKIIPKIQFKNITATSGLEEFYKPVYSEVGNISDEESCFIGSSLALWSFFGAGDLHW